MADEPVTAWREPFARRARRWATRNRTAVTARPPSVLVAAGRAPRPCWPCRRRPKAGSPAGQQRPGDRQYGSCRSQRRPEAAANEPRAAAVRPGRGGDQDSSTARSATTCCSSGAVQGAPRPAAEVGAADFYGKLERLLGNRPDLASRGAMANANYELAELTRKVGKRSAALAAHQKVLAVREGAGGRTAADAEAKADVGGA